MKQLSPSPHPSVNMSVARIAQARILVKMLHNVQNPLLALLRLHLGQMHGRVQRAEFTVAVAAVVGAQTSGVDRERGCLLGYDQRLAVLHRGRVLVVVF